MNRFYITTALCLALAACSSDNDNALPVATVAPEPSLPPPPAVLQSSIVFDVTTGAINFPNDLAFSLPTLSSDGTLVVADEPVSLDAPQAILASSLIAAGSLDGWSTQHPIRIDIQHEQDASLDPVSAAQAGTVRIFSGTLGGDITDPDCQTAALMQACKVGAELQYGIDFSSAAVAGQLQITPLKPLAGGQSYYVVVTNQLQNSAGASVRPSSNYEMLASDAPMNDPGLPTAQQLITSYEALLTSETDLDAADIIYSFSLTTQVTDDISQAIKARYISPYLQAVTNGSAPEEAMALLPQVSVQEAPFDTAFDLFGPLLVGEALFQQLSGLGLASCEALAQTLTMPDSPLFDTAAAVFSQAASFCAASVKRGSVNLPYYSSVTTPLQGRWQAACSSRRATDAIGSTRITNLLNSGELNAGSNNEFCQSVSNGQLWDLDLAPLDIADPRYITRFSPYPQPQGRNSDGTETIAVQFTVPDTAIVNLLATLPDSGVSPISKPESGWPIVVLQHGNTSRKEDFLIMAAALSVAGYATVAIDHPLHGERGITTQNRLVNATSGAGGLSSDYVNPESPLTSQSNNRQSIADILGLRLSLHAITDLTNGDVDIDPNNVAFIGQSLGAITGIPALAVANAPLTESALLGEALPERLSNANALFSVRSAVLSVPGGGIGVSGFDSPGFRDRSRGAILAVASEAFQRFLADFAEENEQSVEQALGPAFVAYEASLDQAQRQALGAIYQPFLYASQSVAEVVDPNNFATLLASNTPVLMHAVVGGGSNDDGSIALPDQVVPNNTETSPSFAGTLPLASFMGLPDVSSTSAGSGLVRFQSGGHSSLLNPFINAAATAEMQRQALLFIASEGEAIVISDNTVIAN